MRRMLAPLVLALGLAGCIPPQSQTERLTNQAYDVAMAARFGRMDIVMDAVRATEREAFATTHAHWGNGIRIVDVEFGGARIVEDGKAVVALTIAWQRIDESILRVTALKQNWERDQRWELVDEVVVGGDAALVPEKPKTDAEPGPVTAVSSLPQSPMQ